MRAYRIEPAKIRVVHLGRDETLAPVHDRERIAKVCRRYGIGTEAGAGLRRLSALRRHVAARARTWRRVIEALAA